jgi:DNA-binding CsgD family transcriptional regulator/pimeloyl-ACP methyl ester carboxylesterase
VKDHPPSATVAPPDPALSATLRVQLAGRQPLEALFESWAMLEALVAHDPAAFADALAEAATLDASAGYAAVAPEGSMGTAVISPSGELAQADPLFIRWFGHPRDSMAFRRLIRLAQKQGQASGLVETADGGVIAACAGTEETALRWPLSAASRAQMILPGKRVALLGFAPSRVSSLAVRAADAFGLTPLEARLAEALLDANNLNEAAERIGVGRETAREALKKAMRKAGAKRSPDLVRRMMDLMSGMQAPSGDVEAVLRSLFGATPAEARAAARFAEGLTARDVAAALGVKEATVRGQLKAVFAKTGVNKAKDLVRLTVEASSLTVLTQASETVIEPLDPEGRLRVVTNPAGLRRIAVLDYGPRGGRPVAVFHGSATGRILPLAFVSRLQKAGFRPLVVQRPGYGLTDPAVGSAMASGSGEALAAGADDLAAVMDTLKLRKIDLLIRDASTPAGLTFAERYPERVGRGMLINPRPPATVERSHFSVIGSVSRTLLRHPELIAAFAEMLRRQSRSDLLAKSIRRSLGDLAGDREIVEDPVSLARLVRDAQGISARSSAGFATEMAAYLDWTAPPRVGGDAWRILYCDGLNWPVDASIWNQAMPEAAITTLKGASFLVYYSHPDEVVSLLEGM